MGIALYTLRRQSASSGVGAMEPKALTRPSESSDTQVCLEDLNDDRNPYASCSMSNLQFRQVVSTGRWIDDLGMAEVVVKKGKMWNSTGIVRNGKVLCFIEEAQFLAEIGAFEILNDDDTPLSMREIYAKALEVKNGCFWESFEVYKHLKSLGYIMGRHGISWSMKSVTTNLHPGTSDIDNKVDCESSGSTCVNETFSGMQMNEVQPIFDVYPPNSKFKKSSPGHPSFVICLARGQPPSKQEVEDLEKRCGGCPLKFCKVDVGRSSFFSIDKVELPVLP